MAPIQSTIDELGTPLRDVTFVVVDLETTGTSPEGSGITEIGAVKVRGGEIVGEFQTLVNPGYDIAPFVALLTGITNAMLVDAPTPAAVLPAFLEFSRGAVIVAHNAPFDTGFLRAGCEQLGLTWPNPTVIDTVRLARATLSRDEVSNCKLSTLATFFRSPITPTHRALDDARATVHVLHGLLERLGRLGVQSLEELTGVTRQVSAAQRRKRHLADDLPASPAVYLFRDQSDRVLYIGKSRHVRTRVRSYFTASEQRRRMTEMVTLTSRVDAIECSSDLEASVRELRLIAEHRPPYNRRSKFPERMVWLKLTVEPFPRLSVVRSRRDDTGEGAAYAGPFSSRHGAEQAAEALLHSIPLRTCVERLPAQPNPSRRSACVLVEMGRCGAPCEGRQSAHEYAPLAHSVRTALRGDLHFVTSTVTERMTALARDERFEDAALWRDRLEALNRGVARGVRLDSLISAGEIIAGERTNDGGWRLHVIRSARLVTAGVAPRGRDPYPVIDALVAMADSSSTDTELPEGTSVEEAEVLLRWLESPGTRLVRVSGQWAMPINVPLPAAG